MSDLDDHAVYTRQEINNDSSIGVVGFVFYLLYLLIMIIACITNGIKTRSDLFTPERKAVSHLKQKPVITGTYAAIMLLTETSIVAFTISMFIMVLTYTGSSIANSPSTCNLTSSIAACTGEVAKITLYLVYLARLHWLYFDSKVRKLLWYLKCSLQWTICFAITIVIYGLITIFAALIIWNSITGHYVNYAGFPDYCDIPMEPVSASFVVIGDLFFSFAFLYAFWKALDKALGINKVKHQDSNKVVEKIKRSGRKTCILTAVATFSTTILMILTVILNLNFVIGFDAVFHAITIMLMTPYYPDKTYYDRICCLCISICGGGSGSSDDNEKEEQLLSVDTFRQLRVLNEQQAATYTQELAEDVNKTQDDLRMIEIQGDNTKEAADKVKEDVKELESDVQQLEAAINESENQ